MDKSESDLQADYDRVAENYAAEFFEELKRKPFDCQMLDDFFLAFHGGEGELHRDEWYGQKVSIDFRLFQGDEMLGYLEAAGFVNIKIVERDPYEFEYPTKRVYAFASKA